MTKPSNPPASAPGASGQTTGSGNPANGSPTGPSLHERLVRAESKRLNPNLPIIYKPLPNGSAHPVRAWTDYKKAVVKMDESEEWTGSFLERKGEDSGLEAVCKSIPGHEVAGHNDSKFAKGCPGKVERHADIKHAVLTELRRLRKKGKGNYATNAIEDIFANTILRGIPGHTNAGLTLFYQKNMGGVSAFYEAFVKLNMACWGDLPDITHLRPYFTRRPEVDKAWKGIVAELKLKPLRIDYNRRLLSDQSKWEMYATVMARHLGPLLDDTVKENTCMHFNIPNPGGGGGGGDPDDNEGGSGDDDEPSQGGGGEDDDGGNPFDDELDDPATEKDIARRFYDMGKGTPAFMDKITALMRLYEALGSMPIDAKTDTVNVRVPIIPYQFTPTKDLGRASLTKFGMDPKGGIEFMEPTERLDIPFVYKKQQREFPSIAILVLDRSPSMLEGIESMSQVGKKDYVPWGDQSKWHYTLLSHFAITNDLIRTGRISQVRNNTLLFATKTKSSGLTPGSRIHELRRWILENPPSKNEGTKIDIEYIRNACSGPQSVIITVSDGEVQEWDAVKDEFLKLTAPHLYAHIQLGSSSNMTRTLNAAHRRVYPVNNGKDMLMYMRGIVAEATK